MKNKIKKMNRREIKKLKAVEIKREPFKKLENNGNKKEELDKKSKEDEDFHETILEKPTDFNAPIVNPEIIEEKIEDRVENLEEFASNLPSTEKKANENPYATNATYSSGGINGSYDSDNRYDNAERYEANSEFSPDRVPGLRTDTTNAFGTPVFGGRQDDRGKEGLTANRLEESARITQQYRRDREATNRENIAPHQARAKREIF